MSDQSDFGEEGENCGLLPICDALPGKAASAEQRRDMHRHGEQLALAVNRLLWLARYRAYGGLARAVRCDQNRLEIPA